MSNSGLPPSHAEYTSSGIASTWSSATVAVVVEREHAEPLDRFGALGDHEEAGERVDVVEPDVGAVGEHGRSTTPGPGGRTGVTSELEVLGAVGVGEHEEPVAGRAGVVLDVVLVALLARLDDRGRRRRVRRRRPATPRSSSSTPS